MSDTTLRLVTGQSSNPARPAPDAAADAPPAAASEQEKLEELRHILLRPERERLSTLQRRFDDPRERMRDLGRALPSAIRQQNRTNEPELTSALLPNITPGLRVAIKNDPQAVIAVIAPVMGPAIRHYIAIEFNKMVQSIDQTMKYSLSAQGLQWRFEALRTGKSFADVVLYHTLVYRVEQVFLIHRETGLLLQHVVASAAGKQDPTQISAMLTALQDFGSDSFGSRREHPPSLKLTDRREVWFETGALGGAAQAILAVVLRGEAPEQLREAVFVPAIEKIHQEYGDLLAAFDGDAGPFVGCRPHLEDCLQMEHRGQHTPRRTKSSSLLAQIPPTIIVPLLLLLLALAVWWFFSWRAERRWQAYLTELKQQPGIAVTEAGRRNGNYFVTGLRDPLADDPQQLLSRHPALRPEDVELVQWKPYYALDPAINERRALLQAPGSVALEIKGDTLIARGAAPHHWIVAARQRVLTIPGVKRFEENGLVDETLAQKQALESRSLLFARGSTRLAPGEEQKLPALAAESNKVLAANASARLEIIGRTSIEGDETKNLRLSYNRAAAILAQLAAQGVNRNQLSAVGAGTADAVRQALSEAERQANRSVSFKVILTAAPQ